MSITNKILDSRSINFIIPALLVSLIVTGFVVSVSILTAFTVLIVAGYAFKFVTRQILVLKTFTVNFVTRLTDKILTLIKHQYGTR